MTRAIRFSYQHLNVVREPRTTTAADGDATLDPGGTANLAVLVGNLPTSSAASFFPGRDAFHRVPDELGTTWKSSLPEMVKAAKNAKFTKKTFSSDLPVLLVDTQYLQRDAPFVNHLS